MGKINVILPAMGEGIFEATITQWLVSEGDTVNEDDSLVEIATDKVDSEIPAPVSGIIEKILVPNGEIAKIGEIIALLKTEATDSAQPQNTTPANVENKKTHETKQPNSYIFQTDQNTESYKPAIPNKLNNGKFLSPLVRSIADKEKLAVSDLELIKGTGLNGRLTKEDILNHLNHKTGNGFEPKNKNTASLTDNIEIIEMDRMRKLIAEHMVHSKQVSPHVTSFHEVDVTTMVKWRDKNKEEYQKLHEQKLTFTPIFIEAVVQAIKKFPMINISVNGSQILKKKNINIGMATALPDGNLIVPVIHKADTLPLSGLVAKVNDLALRARNKNLQPNEIKGGTFTITNVGTFGNLSGTPIINQPEVAILAIGTIKKRPAVIETPDGDVIGIRHQLILSLSYDHRVVDGSLGGMFLKQIADNLEKFDGQKWL